MILGNLVPCLEKRLGLSKDVLNRHRQHYQQMMQQCLFSYYKKVSLNRMTTLLTQHYKHYPKQE